MAPYGSGLQDPIEVVELVRVGKRRTIVKHFPLDKAMDVYQLMSEGKLKGTCGYDTERVSRTDDCKDGSFNNSPTIEPATYRSGGPRYRGSGLLALAPDGIGH
jgi:hypothetical protein